jgi:hypothetical protein
VFTVQCQVTDWCSRLVWAWPWPPLSSFTEAVTTVTFGQDLVWCSITHTFSEMHCEHITKDIVAHIIYKEEIWYNMVSYSHTEFCCSLRRQVSHVRTLININFLWSYSGSAAHLRKVHTSFASWLAYAGVPSAYSIVCKQI